MKQLLMILTILNLLSGCSILSFNKQYNESYIKKINCSSYGGVVKTVNNGREAYCAFPNGKVIPAI